MQVSYVPYGSSFSVSSTGNVCLLSRDAQFMQILPTKYIALVEWLAFAPTKTIEKLSNA